MEEKTINDKLNKVSGGNDTDYEGYAKIDDDSCVCCASCVDECPAKAISFSYLKVSIDPSKCFGETCSICLGVCPTSAIKIITRRDQNDE